MRRPRRPLSRCLQLALPALLLTTWGCANRSARPEASAVEEPSPSPAAGTDSAAQAAPLRALVRETTPVKVAHPQAEALIDPEQAATPAGAEVLRTVASLRDTVVETRYQGKLVIEPENGLYAWDCSGMAAWILSQAAPKARRALASSRPLAKRFFHAIDAAPTTRSRRGWQRLEHVSDAQPGDLFSWLRSPASKSRVTGHVGFFLEQPKVLSDHPEIYAARIVDATSLPHGEDTRARDGEGGFGFGTMLFVTDESGETIAYGWHGMKSLKWGYMPAKVIYGRVTQ